MRRKEKNMEIKKDNGEISRESPSLIPAAEAENRRS
jgi:hypothetical protein